MNPDRSTDFCCVGTQHFILLSDEIPMQYSIDSLKYPKGYHESHLAFFLINDEFI